MYGFIHSVKRWGNAITEYSYNDDIVIRTELITMIFKFNIYDNFSPDFIVTIIVKDYNENTVLQNSYSVGESTLSETLCLIDDDVLLNPYVNKQAGEEWDALLQMVAFC